jgi:hypothetical protein
VRQAGSREVFLISRAQSQSLTSELEDVYDLTFLPHDISPQVEASLQLFEHILLETNDTVIEIRTRDIEEFDNASLGMTGYEILQPYRWEGNDYMVQTVMLENIAFIMPTGIEEVNPTDLSIYGLDTPDRLTVTADGQTKTLLIGNRDAERGGRFVMIEGHDAVLFDPHGRYTFLNVEPTQLLSQLIWLYHIRSVDSVIFELDGVSRVLRYEHDENDDNKLRAWLDDNEISEQNGRRVYIGVLNVFLSGGTDAPIPAAAPVHRFTIRFVEGGSSVLELYRLSDTEFLIVRDGENTNLFITRMSLQQNVLHRFELLDAGRDIP